MNQEKVSKAKTLVVFVLTIVIGFTLFILPNVFFGITKFNGGITGINLAFIGLFQFITVTLLIWGSLKLLKKDFCYIGLISHNWQRDTVIGCLIGITWTILQISFIIPRTGGTARADISQILGTFNGTLLTVFAYMVLGVVGGGITEELFNRGYFINILKDVFKNEQVGLGIATILSIVFFALGHLPTNAVEWIDILVPTIGYTTLFLITGRLTAPIMAHSVYNATAIIAIYITYYAS